MKRFTFLLSGSLLLNGALLAAVFLHRPSSSVERTSIAQPSSTRNSHSTQTDVPGQGSSLQANEVRTLWSALSTDDFDALETRLRAAGFSLRAIHAILQNRIAAYYSERRQRLLGSDDEVPYWRNNFHNTPADAPHREELAALDREMRKLNLKLFFAAVPLDDDEQLARARQRFGNLDTSTLQRLGAIEADYTEMQMAMWDALKPGQEPTAEDRQKLQMFEKERRSDIEKALTPDELAEYDLHASRTASMLRSRLQDFRPSEEEYRALFALFSPQMNQTTFFDEAQATAARAAFEQLKAQAASVLTPERYADFTQAWEGGSDKLSKLVARLDLPLSTVGKVNAVRDDINQRAKAIRDDSTLDSTQRDAQISALADEAKTKLTSTLGGDRGYQAYNDMKGDWIRALQPSTTTKH